MSDASVARSLNARGKDEDLGGVAKGGIDALKRGKEADEKRKKKKAERAAARQRVITAITDKVNRWKEWFSQVGEYSSQLQGVAKALDGAVADAVRRAEGRSLLVIPIKSFRIKGWERSYLGHKIPSEGDVRASIGYGDYERSYAAVQQKWASLGLNLQLEMTPTKYGYNGHPSEYVIQGGLTLP